MSKYLLVLGAPDGASNASFQPIADAMAKGFGEPVPFVVWTDAQLSALPGNADLLTFLAPFNAKIALPDEVFLCVLAGDDVRRSSPGNLAMDRAITTEGALDVLRGIIYVRVVNEADAAKLPGTSITGMNPPPPGMSPSPILGFQQVADANPTRLRMTQVSAILGWPAGKSLAVPVANQALPGQLSVSTQHLAVSPQDAAAAAFMPNLAFQLAVALAGSSGGAGGGGGPLIEPKPATKPDAAAKKQASLFSSPVVLIGALGVGAYFMFFRKKRGHKGSSSRRS